MPDMTNITDTLPDGRTVTSLVSDHDHGGTHANTRFGLTHDTWHAESSSVPPGGAGPPIVITSIDPDTIEVGEDVTITVIGSGFIDDDLTFVWIGAYTFPWTFVSDTELTFDPSTYRFPGNRTVRVSHGDYGSRVFSNPLPLTVNPVPRPTITSTDPASVVEGVPTFIRVFGTNFKEDAFLFHVGTTQPPDSTRVSDTELTATITEPSVGDGFFQLQVQDGSGTWYSPTFNVAVTAPVLPPGPVLTSLDPTSAPTGAILNIKVTGTGFVDGAFARINGMARTTTFVSATEVTVEHIGTGMPQGPYDLVVVNPGTAESNALPFTVTPPPPVVQTIFPTTGQVGVLITLEVNGSGFNLALVPSIEINDVAVPTTSHSASLLTTDWTPPTEGIHYVRVRNTNGLSTGYAPFTATAPVQDDPSAYTIDYIKEWVDDHPDIADEVLTAETARGDDARTTLLSWLQGFIAHRDED
jgi:hypothetical protein